MVLHEWCAGDGSDGSKEREAADGPRLPGLSRADTLRVVRLITLASEASSTASAATATASQFLRAGNSFGGGSGGGSSSAALDTAARDAVLAFKLGMQLRGDGSESSAGCPGESSDSRMYCRPVRFVVCAASQKTILAACVFWHLVCHHVPFILEYTNVQRQLPVPRLPDQALQSSLTSHSSPFVLFVLPLPDLALQSSLTSRHRLPCCLSFCCQYCIMQSCSWTGTLRS